MNEGKLSEEEVSGEEKIKRDLIGKFVKIVYSDDSYNWYKVITYDGNVVEAENENVSKIVFIPWTHIKKIILGDDYLW